ncbi:hypothetical protein vseg_012412 [Gypsophila vaccaria]
MSTKFAFSQNPSTNLNTIPQKIVAKNKKSKIIQKNSSVNKNNNNNIRNININKPLKVVYISNPMRFEVNADEFQTKVQELTGRDAVEWPDEAFNNLAQDVACFNNGTGGVVYDDVAQQEPLIGLDQVVQVVDDEEFYDGSSPDDCFGPLDDGNDGMFINMEDIQAFMLSDM